MRDCGKFFLLPILCSAVEAAARARSAMTPACLGMRPFPKDMTRPGALAAPLRCRSAAIYTCQSDSRPGSNMADLAHEQVGEHSMREEARLLPLKSKSCTKSHYESCSGRTIR